MANDAPLEHVQRPGWSQGELDFANALEARGVTIEAFVYRPHVGWLSEMYGYRLTLPNGWQKTGFIPWDDQTFTKVLAETEEAQ